MPSLGDNSLMPDVPKGNVPRPPSPTEDTTLEDEEGDHNDNDLEAMEEHNMTDREIFEEKAQTSLFGSTLLSCLSPMLLLLNSFRTHGSSNFLINEVFHLLS